MERPIISVKNLSKKYSLGERQPYYSLRDTISGILHTPFRKNKLQKDEFWALKDVSFDINEGEVIGVIGRNGAGKSTLLKILSQITPPTEGEITLRGRVASLLEVGTGFHQELTGRENIFLNGAILGMKRWEINSKFKDIVEFAEIERFLDTPVKRYSSGMYTRLAFSVAAFLDPNILLVDEVLAVGDIEFQKKCLGKMGEIANNSGRTILFVSHNMGAIKSLCPKTIYLKDGKLSMYGNTDNVINHYIKDSTKNVLPSIVSRGKREGSGVVRVKNISITNQLGDDSISSFDKLIIKVSLSKLKKTDNIQLKIPIIDSTSEVLFRVDTEPLPGAYFTNSTLTIETGELNITSTKCFVNIGVFVNGELADYVKDAYSFDILKSNHGKARSYDKEMCLLMIPHRIIR